MTVLHPLETYPYQEYGIQKLVSRRRGALLGKPGIGKTRIILEALYRLGVVLPDEHPDGPIIIVCSGPAVATWVRQIPEWIPFADESDITVVSGVPQKRANMWAKAKKSDYGFYICNAAIFLRDNQLIGRIRWGSMVADEYHKTMLNRTQTFKAFLKISLDASSVIWASGSAYSKHPGSMYTSFAIAEPKAFKSYWRFVENWCLTVTTPFRKEIVGPKNVENYRLLVDRYHAFIPDDVVAAQLPDGHRYPVDVVMDKQQKRVYDGLIEDMYTFLDNGEMVVAQTVLTRLIMLRKLLCCPKMVKESMGMGAGFEYIVDQLEIEPHAVIFVPFRDACDYIAEELGGKGYHVGILRGQVTLEEQQSVIKQFKAHRGVIVCTIAYAESFDLETCHQSWFLGYEFTVKQNTQAEGRTQRAISKHDTVHWGYIRYRGTVDDDLLQALITERRDIKRINTRSDEFIQKLLPRTQG